MSLRKPCHKPFRKLTPPFTLTVLDYKNGLDECMGRLQPRLAAYRNPSKPAHPQTGVFKKKLQSL